MNEADYNTSNFYRLHKIHKSRLINNNIKKQNSEVVRINEPQTLKVRPIVGWPTCPTSKISKLIDTLLKTFLKHVQSYIRDINFLNKCDRNTDENTVTATFDVVGLYTNISHTLGLEGLGYLIP